jgi:hypothetical protein
MGMPAPAPQMMTGPAEPVPVAFSGRTSTFTLQDPVASMRKQVRECQAKLPPGWYIAAWFWDIESGGLPTEARGQGSAHEQFPGIGIPRDGGFADLLAAIATKIRHDHGIRAAVTRSGWRWACRSRRCGRPCRAGHATSSPRQAESPWPRRPAGRPGTRSGT